MSLEHSMGSQKLSGYGTGVCNWGLSAARCLFFNSQTIKDKDVYMERGTGHDGKEGVFIMLIHT